MEERRKESREGFKVPEKVTTGHRWHPCMTQLWACGRHCPSIMELFTDESGRGLLNLWPQDTATGPGLALK